MRIRKICFLLDPDKPDAVNVFNAFVRLQEIFDRRFSSRLMEYWVGGTKASSDDIIKWLKKMKNKGLGKRIIYPSRISHISGYPYADYILIPYLLNWTNLKVFIYNLIGILISKFYKRRQLFGYLIMSNGSSVGKLVGARRMSNEEALKIVKNFLDNSSSKVIYLEAGSGARTPVPMDLIKEVSKIVHSYPFGSLIVGGGIKTAEEVKKLFSIGVNKVVIGTALEKYSMEKSLDVMKRIIKPFKALSRNR